MQEIVKNPVYADFADHQIGASSGADVTLPSAVLRSTAVQLVGSGLGSIPFARLIHAIGEVFAAAIPGNFKIAI